MGTVNAFGALGGFAGAYVVGLLGGGTQSGRGVIAGGWGMAVPEATARLRAAAFAEGRLVVDVVADVLLCGNTTMGR